MVEFLEFLKKVNKNNILLLWTRAKKSYINKFVLLLGIGNYFDHILSREECKDSFKKYKCYKSFRYIMDNFPKYINMRSFLIDNLAFKNGGGGSSDPIFDNDTDDDDNDNDNSDSVNNYYFRLLSVKPFTINDVINGSDSTLLNLMLYLDKNYFNNNFIFKKYKVLTTDKNGNLQLEERFNPENCDVFVTSWYAKL